VGGSKACGPPHPFPPLPLSIPPKFSDNPEGGKVRSSEGEVPRFSPYKYHPGNAYECLVTNSPDVSTYIAATTGIQLSFSQPICLPITMDPRRSLMDAPLAIAYVTVLQTRCSS